MRTRKPPIKLFIFVGSLLTILGTVLDENSIKAVVVVISIMAVLDTLDYVIEGRLFRRIS